MSKQIDVRFLPSQTEIPVAGACVVMTDVLRASSTMVTALANGAEQIIPQAEISDSRKIAESLRAESRDVLIGGERNGVIIDGFQLGNSPLEYTRERVAGRSIVLCTSNGTWALEFCRGAAEILIGSLINLQSIVNVASRFERTVVVCAGTNREPTGEDILFAGGVAAGICEAEPGAKLNDMALVAHALWRDMARYQTSEDSWNGSLFGEVPAATVHSIYDYFLTTRGGANLKRLDYTSDLKYCAQLNSHSNTPRLDQTTWIIQ